MSHSARFTLAAGLLWIGLITAQVAHAQVYVDVDASGGNDGTSWTDAYTNLTNAIALEADGSTFWIAEGSYAPGSDTAYFDLKGSNVLYGGFAGTETILTQRNVTANETRLEGGGSVDNILKKGTAGRSILDGFTVANGDGVNGVGINASAGSIDVRNCTFTNNVASEYGGAIFTHPPLPTGANMSKPFWKHLLLISMAVLASGSLVPGFVV